MRSVSTKLLALAAILLGWELLCRTGWVPDALLPRPLAVAGQFLAAALSGEMVRHMSRTFGRVLLGFLLGALGGTALSLSFYFLPYFNTTTKPLVRAFMITPKSVFIPYFLILFGRDEAFLLGAITIAVALQITVTIDAGLSSVDRDLVEMVKGLGARPHHVLTDVIMPSLLPYFILSIRIGMESAVRQAIFIEAVFSMKGLGSKLWSSSQGAQGNDYFVYLLLTMALGSGLAALLNEALRRLAPWHDAA